MADAKYELNQFLGKLGISSKTLQRIRFGGVVGKQALVAVFVALGLATVAVRTTDTRVLILCVAGLVVEAAIARFLHVGLSCHLQSPEQVAAVDQAIGSEAFDWLRYSFSCYLVWSSSDAETICRKILRVPGMENTAIFISGIDVNDAFGFLAPVAWEWIRQDRGRGPVNTWQPIEPPGLPSAWPPLPPSLLPK